MTCIRGELLDVIVAPAFVMTVDAALPAPEGDSDPDALLRFRPIWGGGGELPNPSLHFLNRMWYQLQSLNMKIRINKGTVSGYLIIFKFRI